MKIFLTLAFSIILTACANSNKQKTPVIYQNYNKAVAAIEQENYEQGYRLFEQYYMFDDLIKNPTTQMLEVKSRIADVINGNPLIANAGLNTFTEKSFYKTLQHKKGNKQRVISIELLRLRTFKKLVPEKYPQAEKNFTHFFGKSPEDAALEISRTAKAQRDKKGITVKRKRNFTNMTASGSLEVTRPISCVEINTLTNKHTPADIFTGISDCIKKDDVQRATRLYALALAYGRYDQLRMVDKSARAAIGALQYNHIITSKEFRQRLKEEIKNHSVANKNSEKFISLCRDIKKLGKPAYHPRYMIKHGMSVFTGSASGIIEDFNEEENWNKIYTNYLKCS
ncbi:MAG: hypothetical protein OQK75_02615 [Gammaproteobacteria bacterium]|nr:hypothetical protein [Gammaproteobacteria bacterium]MCW8986540.1 hypothetical protein [Gammaproteobacteria bacterium]